jgi:hypothetical protein
VKVVAVFLGIAVAVLSVVAVVLVQTADEARDEAAQTNATAGHPSHESESSAVSLPLQSFAGKTGENAEALAQAHTPTTPCSRRYPRATWSRSTWS